MLLKLVFSISLEPQTMFAAPSGGFISKTPHPPSPIAANIRTGPSSYLIDTEKCGAAVLRFGRDQTIMAQGDIPRYCYQVTSGCIRTVKLLDDGRRQIGEFLFAGDIFGWEGGDRREFAAEAVTPSTLQRFRLDEVERQTAGDAGFARRLHHYIISQVRLARERLVVVGCKTATERACSFLVEMHGRLAAPGRPDFILPMTRTDIADYLGVTLETVSRAFSGLRQRGMVTVSQSNIVIRDQLALCSAGSLLVH
jgi:CRP/FNR family transcriptional regulator, nitrogen fixation regulation protein